MDVSLGADQEFALRARDALLKVAKKEGIPLMDLISQMGENIHRFIPMDGGIDDIAYRLGPRDAKPREPIVMKLPDGNTPLIVVGAGQTEVAEIADIVAERWEDGEKKVREGKPQLDSDIFEERRADEGLPPRDQFDSNFREGLRDKIDYHKKNHRTDPAPVRIEKPKGQSHQSTGKGVPPSA